MKKILVFSPYYPPHIGGLESHAHEFNEQMSLLGYHVTVFSPRLPNNAPQKEEFRKSKDGGEIAVYRFPAWEIINNYPVPKFWSREFWQLYRLIKKDRYSAIISRTRFFSTSILALIFAKSAHTFWLHIEHGSDYVQSDNRFVGLVAYYYDRIFGRMIFASADEVVANSEASAKFAKIIYGKRNYSIIYRGVEKDKILKTKSGQQEKREGLKKTIITYVGRLIDGKGVIELLEAIKVLNAEDFLCWIIGDGSQKRHLEDKVEEFGLKSVVTFFGEKSHSESLELISKSDIFVNPSYTEGLPTSVIEAALLSKPIIATDVGGTREIVREKSGIRLVPPRDSAAIAATVTELANDANLRKSMGDVAFKDVFNRFDWRESAKRYDEIIRSNSVSQFNKKSISKKCVE